MREKLNAVWAYICALDPGSLRSLIWVAMSFMGMDQGESAITYAAGAVTVILGLTSAMMPSKVLLPNEVAVVPPATGTTTTTVTQKAAP
jgi:uncharacterized membrane protein